MNIGECTGSAVDREEGNEKARDSYSKACSVWNGRDINLQGQHRLSTHFSEIIRCSHTETTIGVQGEAKTDNHGNSSASIGVNVGVEQKNDDNSLNFDGDARIEVNDKGDVNTSVSVEASLKF